MTNTFLLRLLLALSTGFIICSWTTLKEREDGKVYGMSIILKRMPTAEKISEIENLDKFIVDSLTPHLNLERATEDLGIILMNTPRPFQNPKLLPYRLMHGNIVRVETNSFPVGGFIPTSQVVIMCNWIRAQNLLTEKGFYKLYSGLTKEAKEALELIDASSKKDLYRWYMKPLVNFYLAAEKEKNSIIFYGD